VSDRILTEANLKRNDIIKITNKVFSLYNLELRTYARFISNK